MANLLLDLMNWATDNFLRPFLILIMAILMIHVNTLVYKCRLLYRTVLYFLLCWDKNWKKPRDPGSIFGPHLSRGLEVDRKTIFFVRHGESTWNDTFNKGKHRSKAQFVIFFIPGLIKSLVCEFHLLLSGKIDSWFYDSPLSHLGLNQADELGAFLNEKPLDGPEAKYIKILRGDSDAPTSTLISSPLRRAVATLVVGFRDRLLQRKDDKIVVVDSLQEISRNPDTLSITPPRTPIQASWVEETASGLCDFQTVYNTKVDVSRHLGDKPVGTNGLVRLLDFCDFAFTNSDDFLIVGGHSIWFRSFFQMFLPYSVHHNAKTKKIVNGGVIVFDLMKADTTAGAKYMIDPKTIQVIYGGF